VGGLPTDSFGSATRLSSGRSPCARTPGDPAYASYDVERGRATAERTAARLAELLTEIARFEMPRPAGS
jgi:hypothetical protein